VADPFELLRSDHQRIERMVVELEEGRSSAAGATQEELKARKSLSERLVAEVSGHEAAEELCLWPVVRDRVADGNQLADHGLGQEREAKRLLAALDRLQPRDDGFERLLAEFTAAARDHISFEEIYVWPALRDAVGTDRADELGDDLASARAAAPTRPHPTVPPHPAVLKAVGPAVAAADRLRDGATGRGRD
jgi:hemerythrin superfamily protein